MRIVRKLGRFKIYILLFLGIIALILFTKPIIFSIQEKPTKLPIPVCGNGICEENETQESCCLDCGCPAQMSCIKNSCIELKCFPVCKAVGTRSEGWYDSCSNKLLKWAKCGVEGLKGIYCVEPRPKTCYYLLYDPVCGVNEEIKNYPNPCTACLDKRVKFWYKGKC
jgi:hypothetical protein